VNVSYDGAGGDYALVRGVDGAGAAERAMALLAEAGIPFGVNVVLTRSTFARLEETVRRAEDLGAREAQLLRYKPAGRAKDASYLATRLGSAQIDRLYATLERLVLERTISIRVDCAMLPLLSGAAIDPAVLMRFGVLGCEAGRHLAAVRVDGRLAPCSFAPAAEIAVDDVWEGVAEGWRRDPTLESWRALPEVEPCLSCPLRATCRGGCRVVAEHLTDGLGPDPECPRVRAWSERGAHA
jgi:radical SAM protein with 4Fe4S-binding SPASM domain